MRYPEFLQLGDTIEVIAPSFGCTTEPYSTQLTFAVKYFKELGYNVIVRDNVYKDDGIGKSTNPKDCGKEINNAFKNQDSKIVFSSGGGELMCEDLNYVDFKLIKNAKPKWYIGYSDNTNLTFLLPTICDTASLYAPCFPSFGQTIKHESLNDTLSILQGKTNKVHNYMYWEKESLKDENNPLVTYNCVEKTTMHMHNGDSTSFNGYLLGGCLDCLINLAGTSFDKVKEFNKKYKDVIWFIESCDLNVFGMRRALWQLKNASWFDNAKGFLIGRPLNYGQDFMGLNHYNAVTGILEDLNVPIILDCDIGHLPPMMPIMCGAYASVTYGKDKLNIEYQFK